MTYVRKEVLFLTQYINIQANVPPQSIEAMLDAF
jgi:hypothetical protein